jgi:hypothetical protein
MPFGEDLEEGCAVRGSSQNLPKIIRFRNGPQKGAAGFSGSPAPFGAGAALGDGSFKSAMNPLFRQLLGPPYPMGKGRPKEIATVRRTRQTGAFLVRRAKFAGV